MDMTSIWVSEHGWVYLNAIIDCCTREIIGWEFSLRCRAVEAIAVIEAAIIGQAIGPGMVNRSATPSVGARGHEGGAGDDAAEELLGHLPRD